MSNGCILIELTHSLKKLFFIFPADTLYFPARGHEFPAEGAGAPYAHPSRRPCKMCLLLMMMMMMMMMMAKIIMYKLLCDNAVNADDGICSDSVCHSGAPCSEVMNQVTCHCPSSTGGERCADSMN